MNWNRKIKFSNRPKTHKCCERCLMYFPIKHTIQKYCSAKCKHMHRRESIALSQKFSKWGRIGGLKANELQIHRSKNEIHFANKCIEYFGEDRVLCNVAMFDGWDADIILPLLKTAVRWNGIWHYKQVRKEHNLKQVQTRDKVKEAIIKKHGYSVYIIKDMGGVDQKFVEEQFKIFLETNDLPRALPLRHRAKNTL